MKPTALVTGAHGFLGRRVVQAAKDSGYLVVGIGHEEATGGQDVTRETLRTLDIVPSLILHCAGSATVNEASWRDDVETTHAVLGFARERAPETRLVLVSSAAVYGGEGSASLVESAPRNPISSYGRYKLAAENLVEQAARDEKRRASIVRFFSIYGPGLRKQLPWDACRKASQNEPRFQGTGTETRDFLHVDDAARLLLLAGENATSDCPIWNGGTGEAVSTQDLVGRICERFGTGAPQFDGRRPPEIPRHLVADTRRARELGFEPSIGWIPGIDEYIDWFRA